MSKIEWEIRGWLNGSLVMTQIKQWNNTQRENTGHYVKENKVSSKCVFISCSPVGSQLLKTLCNDGTALPPFIYPVAQEIVLLMKTFKV